MTALSKALAGGPGADLASAALAGALEVRISAVSTVLDAVKAGSGIELADDLEARLVAAAVRRADAAARAAAGAVAAETSSGDAQGRKAAFLPARLASSLLSLFALKAPCRRAARGRGAASTELAAARKSLGSAHGRRDWEAAERSVDLLSKPHALSALGETDLVRLAEAAVGLGDWESALAASRRVCCDVRRGSAEIVAIRARLGLGEVEAAWRGLMALAGDATPRAVPLAQAALRALGDVDRALAPMADAAGSSGAAAKVALARALVAEGRHAQARAIARALWRFEIGPDVRVALLETRCALSAGGWPARVEARWAALVRRWALGGRVSPAEAVRRLADCRWHKPAWRVLDETGCDATGATLMTLALGLAWEGALDEPAALLERMRGTEVACRLPPLERHVAAMEKLKAERGAPAGPRPATRLLLGMLEAPAILSHRPDGPRRLAHVATSFSVGGAERQLAAITRGMAARHPGLVQDALLSGDLDGALTPRTEPGETPRIRLRATRALDVGAPPQPGLDPLTGRVARLQRIESFRKIFTELRPDAVMVWKPEVTALIGAVLAGVPRVVLRNGSVAPTRRHWMREHQTAVADYAAEGFRWLGPQPAMRFVSNSQAALTELTADLHWPPERSAVLYNALDVERFATMQTKAQSRARLGLPGDAVVVGGCFRLSPEKRPLLWLDAAEVCLRAAPDQNLAFTIAGGGPLRETIAARLEARGLSSRIRLLGQLEAGIADFHNAIDILLHTASFEGLPNALVEAQAKGVPVVSTPAGGAAEAFLPGETGLLVRDASVATLSDAVLAAAADLPAYRAKRGDFEAFVAGRFSLDACLDRVDELLGFGERG